MFRKIIEYKLIPLRECGMRDCDLTFIGGYPFNAMIDTPDTLLKHPVRPYVFIEPTQLSKSFIQ